MRLIMLILQITAVALVLGIIFSISSYIAITFSSMGLSAAMDFVVFVALTGCFCTAVVASIGLIKALVERYVTKLEESLK